MRSARHSVETNSAVYVCMNRQQSEQMGYCIHTGRGLLLHLYTLAVECGSDSPFLLWSYGGAHTPSIDQLRLRRPPCPWSSGTFGLGLITRGRSGWVVNLMS